MTFSKLFVVSVIGVLLTISRDPSWTRPTNMRNCVFQWLSCRPVSDFPKEKNGWAILAKKNDQWYPATDPALVGLLQDLRGLTRQDIEDPALHATVDLPIVPAEFGNSLFQQRNPNLLRQGRGRFSLHFLPTAQIQTEDPQSSGDVLLFQPEFCDYIT